MDNAGWLWGRGSLDRLRAKQGDEVGLLILGPQRLVVLEVPKTASQAMRKMLEPYTAPLFPKVDRHIGMIGYLRLHEAAICQALGGPVETLAVMREPLRRMQSWYRYRQRDSVAQTKSSTRGISFEEFIRAYLMDKPPDFARGGRQDRMIGWNGTTARVDHLFDYRRLDRLERFLSRRIGEKLTLPWRNVSPSYDDVDYSLSEDLMAQYLTRNEAEFALYRKLRETGYLHRGTVE